MGLETGLKLKDSTVKKPTYAPLYEGTLSSVLSNRKKKAKESSSRGEMNQSKDREALRFHLESYKKDKTPARRKQLKEYKEFYEKKYNK